MIERLRMIGLAVALLAQPAAAIELSAPVACPAGMTCPIQNLFDHDPSPTFRDYRCGPLGYDGHNGVDIRLPSMAVQKAGVPVLAAADGRVLGMRDGMADVGIAGAGREALKNVECGNGLMLAHEDGYTTQYCHMARGSIAAAPGDTVTRGQKLGLIGLSGMTEFPHLHFTLRKDGKPIDPYAVDGPSQSCGETKSVWRQPDADGAMKVVTPFLMTLGLSGAAVPMEQIDSGEAGAQAIGPDPAVLVTFGRVIGLSAGDVFSVTLRGPDGKDLKQVSIPPLPSPKAQWSSTTGVQRPPGGWPPGDYRGVAEVLRDGRTVTSREVTTRIGQ